MSFNTIQDDIDLKLFFHRDLKNFRFNTIQDDIDLKHVASCSKVYPVLIPFKMT